MRDTGGLGAGLGMFGGVRIVESLHMVDTVEDWSRVRSPARARRRLKYGYPQRIRTIAVPKPGGISTDGGRTIYMHPETARRLRALSKGTDHE